MTLDEAKAKLRHFANLPNVLPRIGPIYSFIDLDYVLVTPGNVVFFHPEGAIMALAMGDGVYEGHSLMSETLRGSRARDFALYAMRSLFDKEGAAAIMWHIPVEHRTARLMSRVLGCTPRGPSVDIYGRPCITYTAERETWAASVVPSVG